VTPRRKKREPWEFSAEELAWIAENDPELYAEVEALLEQQLQELRAEQEASEGRRQMSARWGAEARPEQIPPDTAWFIWLILAGRGWGKTRTGAEWCAAMARRYPGCRIAIVAATAADARDTMVEGESGLLSVIADSELRGGSRDTGWNRSLGELFLANGSRFKCFSAEKPGRLRGPQHHFAWADEPAVWADAQLGAKASPEKDTTWSNLQLGLRNKTKPEWPAGYSPRVVATTTPKPVRLLKAPQSAVNNDPSEAGLMQKPAVHITTGKTDENIANLDEVYIAQVVDPLRGTRLGMQELDAMLLEDDGQAIFKRGKWRFHVGRVWQQDFNAGVFHVAPGSLIVQSWDCAFKDLDTSDYVVGQVWEISWPNAYLIDQVHDKLDFTATCAAIQGKRAKWPQTGAILIEDKANGPAVISVLRQTVPGLIAINPGQDSKVSRAQATTPFIEGGNVFLPEPGVESWVEEFIEECVAFPNGPHDDQVDAMTQLLRHVFLPEVDTKTHRHHASPHEKWGRARAHR
jgi:predicted phage terminase large subunit-like protein